MEWDTDPIERISGQNYNLMGVVRTAAGFYKGSPIVMQLMIHPFQRENPYHIETRHGSGEMSTHYGDEKEVAEKFDMLMKKYKLEEVAKSPAKKK